MKLAVLSRAPNSYSTQRLRSAALERGHDVRVLNTLRFAIDLSEAQPDLQYRGKPLSEYDAVFPRIGASITFFGTASCTCGTFTIASTCSISSSGACINLLCHMLHGLHLHPRYLATSLAPTHAAPPPPPQF